VLTLLAAALIQQVQVREEVKDWKLIKSEHFDLYYPSDEMEPRAHDFAAMFEDARERIAKSCGAVLERRINVFLYRSYHDLGQSSFLGQGRGMPDLSRPVIDQQKPKRPCCRLAALSRAFALAEPTRDRIFIHCQASDRWNQWFVRHELVHQLQFQQIFPWRLPSFLIALKNPLIPQWFWEGFADYGAGIFDAAKDEWVRDLARENVFTLKEMWSGDVLNDHDYLAVYYLGSMFFKFLDEELGPGTAAGVFKTYARTFPLTLNRVLRSSTGRTQGELEELFKAWLTRRYAEINHRGDPWSNDKRLMKLQGWQEAYYRRHSWGERLSPDGRHVAYVSDKEVSPELFIDEVGRLGVHRTWDFTGIHSPPSWTADSKRLVIAIWWVRTDYLFIVDLEKGDTSIKMTMFDEVADPSFSPDGSEIVFVGMKNGTSDLYVMKLSDRSIRRLTDDPDGESAPAWSLDGTSVAYLHEVGGRTVLTLLDLESGKSRAVTATNALLERPQWAPDGKSLVVSADIDGVYDAFAIDVSSGAASRLTRFRGGVHFPAVSPDGQTLLFTYFDRRGLSLQRIPFKPQEEKNWAQEDRKDWYDLFKKPAPTGEKAEKSRVFGIDYFMAPFSSQSFVIPGLDFELGDLEAENVLSMTAVGASARGWLGQASYRNTRFRPTLGAMVLGQATGSSRVVGGGPFIEIPYAIFMHAGWVGRETHEFDDDSADPHAFDSGPNLALAYSCQLGVNGRDPSWGFFIGGNAFWFRDDLGGDRDLTEYTGVFETSYGVQQDWLLWLRLSYAKKNGPLLESEVLEIESAVRGSTRLEGSDVGGLTLELRFPLWRDLFLMPFEFIGLGEYLIFKDLRAFLFGDAGFAGLSEADLNDRENGAASAGVGLRVDLFAFAWPIWNQRTPIRLEVWYARVGQTREAPGNEVGFGFVLGY